MVKLIYGTPFVSLVNRTTTTAFASVVSSHQNVTHSYDSLTYSQWGCSDEIGVVQCSRLQGLFEYDGVTCRWPTAELCLRTCGQCQKVLAADRCQSYPDDCISNSSEIFPWGRFFEQITSKHDSFSILNRDTPWVAEFPNFLNDAEVDELIRISLQEGYRDEDDLPNHIRDVSVMNCDSVRCMTEPFMNELYGRVSALLDIPANNFESMEFIHYAAGQHYAWHADEYSWKDEELDPVAVLSGPRILTMFFYLSDVEEGGETAFAGPDPSGRTKRLAVKPERGKMILWANMQDNWRKSDHTAVHTAAPVRKGRKIAGTIWIHASGFRIPELYAGRDCHSRLN